jgi:hypothetical protein
MRLLDSLGTENTEKSFTNSEGFLCDLCAFLSVPSV